MKRTTKRTRKHRKIMPFAIAILCIPVLLMIIIIATKTDHKTIIYDYTVHEVAPADYQYNDYNGEIFAWVDGLLTYDDDNYYSVTGIDVSQHQGNIDFYKVKEDGIDFVYLRIGYRGYETGELHLDSRFENYYTQAKEAGLEVGVYFFSAAIDQKEAMDEAYFVLENIIDKDIDGYVVFDFEDISYDDARYKDLTNEEKSDIATAFCEVIKNNDYKPMIYANSYWFNNIYDLSKVYNYDIWIAQYDSVLSYPYDFKIWQYTENGTVDGIPNPVDINILLIHK